MQKKFFIVTAFGFSFIGCKEDPELPPPPPPPALVDFVNWESTPIHGLEQTPDKQRLIAANTADARIEVFDTSSGVPTHLESIPVGLDPVSVRARSNNELWVVNQISDSISVVDLAQRKVIATIQTGDEPADVVFAGSPQRAFVSISQENKLQSFNPDNLAEAPQEIAIEGEDPRALTTDGTRVFAAIFESGNKTTILAERVVSSASSPYGGQNPPQSVSDPFQPSTTPPKVGLIVQKAADGTWRDENDSDWSAFVPWDLHDHDVAIIDTANANAVTYETGLMNLNMSLALRHDGRLAVVGSDATNQIRFEPALKSTFSRMILAGVDPTQSSTVTDLNPHLDYQTKSIAAAERSLAISDPRSIVWSATVDQGFVAGMGSDNVIELNAAGERLATIPVGQGPVALALDEQGQRLYVLNRFDASISTIDTQTNAVLATLPFFDPTPTAIKAGRPLLYNATRFSGLGQVSCASCHVDARMDQLSWDLGDPDGAPQEITQVCQNGPCQPFHPMKGPMMTQTFQGIIGTEPLHWRGDREDLAAFAGAFVSLLGSDAAPSAKEMQAFEDYVATIIYPPNPNRNFDGSLPNVTFANGGNPVVGEELFLTGGLDGGLQCNDCHDVPTGTDGGLHSFIALQETQSFKVAQLRNMNEKFGFDKTSLNNNKGFGFLHDGSDDTVAGDFLHRGPFTFADGEEGEQQRRDIEAFMLSFSIDTHASVGEQLTFTAEDLGAPNAPALEVTRQMFAAADAKSAGLVLKGIIEGEPRGYVYDETSGLFVSDRAGESFLPDDLLVFALGNPVTLTMVPFGTQRRFGVDRDADGKLDRDELDAGTNPNDPTR